MIRSNDIKEMLFGEKGGGFEDVRAAIGAEVAQERVDLPPQYMMMKITNYCNSDCVYCNHARSKIKNEIKNEISLERLQKIVAEAIGLGVKAISISGGEPLVRKDVEVIVRQIAEHNVWIRGYASLKKGGGNKWQIAKIRSMSSRSSRKSVRRSARK